MFGKWKKEYVRLRDEMDDLMAGRNDLQSENDKLNDKIKDMQRKNKEDLQIPLNTGLFNFMGEIIEIQPNSEIEISSNSPSWVSMSVIGFGIEGCLCRMKKL